MVSTIQLKNGNDRLPSHYERNSYNDDKISVVEESDLGASLKQLNDDSINSDKMSGIDMRARLSPSDISCSVIVDMLVMLKFLPDSCVNITKQKKRLSVSLMGKGRKEIVDVIAGEREKQSRDGSMMSKLGLGKKD